MSYVTGKPYLGKLGEICRPDHIAGRFLGLLPSAAHAQAAKEVSPASDALPRIRRSSELPDDVGRVFVTNVPGAPIQVMGRRDPANGELCLGSVMQPDQSDIAAWTPDWVEIVTGPEAERLILAVHQACTREANEQHLTFDEYFAAQADATKRAWPDKVQQVREEAARRRSRGDNEGADFLEKWIADQEQAQ